MSYVLLFLAGLLLGALPAVRRAIETLRWAVLCSWAARKSIAIEEIKGDEVLKMIQFGPKPAPAQGRVRRAK